jgi:putative FmdB family regulatory protein
MPIYEFKCGSCGEVFEEFFTPGESDAAIQCPKCESGEVKKLLSACSAQVSGGTSTGGACAPAPGGG